MRYYGPFRWWQWVIFAVVAAALLLFVVGVAFFVVPLVDEWPQDGRDRDRVIAGLIVLTWLFPRRRP